MIDIKIYTLCKTYMLNPGGAAASCAIDNAGAIRAKAARAMFENLHMVLSGGRKNGEALLWR